MEKELNQPTELRLTDLEPGIGEAKELPPQDRARLKIAGWVLGSLAVLTVLAGGVYVYAPENRLEAAKQIFEFTKTIVPPIATLVIGFYFRNEGSSG